MWTSMAGCTENSYLAAPQIKPVTRIVLDCDS
jgi:hypothetical protein